MIFNNYQNGGVEHRHNYECPKHYFVPFCTSVNYWPYFDADVLKAVVITFYGEGIV